MIDWENLICHCERCKQRKKLMVSEMTITIRDDEKTLKKKFLIHDTFQVDENDPMIRSCIAQTLENFSGEPERVIVKIAMYLS
jgi:hypothetical protein